jgi:transcriptional regulator with XRE-family HTH domain
VGSGVLTKLERQTLEDEEERWTRAAISVLRGLRNDADLSQPALAMRAGWTVRMLLNFEKGRKTMQLRHVVRIARALAHDPAAVLAEIARRAQSEDLPLQGRRKRVLR